MNYRVMLIMNFVMSFVCVRDNTNCEVKYGIKLKIIEAEASERMGKGINSIHQNGVDV